jgi:tetratricopeptide (TPR) repeat protein
MRDKAFQLVQEGKYDEALTLLRSVIEGDPSDWNSIYLAGQCCRFLNDLDGAFYYLRKATDINPNDSSVWLALGIACQLKGNWDDAIDALRKALQIDPDCVLAFNSLALTQKKMGELEKANHNYNAGAQALSRCIVMSMTNTPDNQILPHRNSRNGLWSEYAMYGAMYLVANEETIEGIAWPTGEMAEEEGLTHKHRGLLWAEHKDHDGKPVRLFLPNYFSTFYMTLRSDRTFSELMGNRGMVLEMLGKQEDAQKHLQEAEEFLPR